MKNSVGLFLRETPNCPLLTSESWEKGVVNILNGIDGFSRHVLLTSLFSKVSCMGRVEMSSVGM